MANELKPIVLTVTIYPPKKGVRKVVVTGAPEGEMPLLLSGVFAERHALIDQAFSGVLKRDPQVVTLKEEKPAKASKSKSKGTVAADDDEPGDEGEAVEASDQPMHRAADAGQVLVSDNPLPASPVDTGEEQETAQLSDISEPVADLPVIEGDDTNNEVGNDGEQD